MMAIDTSLYRSPFSQQLRAEGKVDALRRVLRGRGISITQEQSDLLARCDDPNQADKWIDRALTATQASEVFDAD